MTYFERSDRRTGWKKIRVIEIPKTEHTIAIYLESNGNRFMAEVGDKKFHSTNVSEIIKQVEERIYKMESFEWIHIIQANIYNTRFHSQQRSAQVNLNIKDFMVTTTPEMDGHYKMAELNPYKERNTFSEFLKRSRSYREWNPKKDGELKPPCRTINGKYVILPFDENTLEGLKILQNRIIGLRTKISEFLISAEGIPRLHQAAKDIKALPVPSNNFPTE